MQREQILIEWIIKSYIGSRLLLLVVGNKNYISPCVMIANQEVSSQPFLDYDH